MRKIITLDETFGGGEPTMTPVLLWNAQGKPLYDRVKHASEASEYIKHVEPKPGMSVILVLALGAYEYYDLNRNGDGFNERPYKVGMKTLCGHPECQSDDGWIAEPDTIPHHYKSFEEHGKVYRHHCFPAGTKVVRGDRVRTEIENIQIGDLVETRHGPRKVVNVLRRFYEGEGRRLTLRGVADDLVSTADHPVLVYRRNVVHCSHNYSRLGRTDHMRKLATCRGDLSEPEWLPVSEVQPGDYLCFPRPTLGTRAVAPEFAELVGWVASEGYLGERGSIQFTFSTQNSADIASVTACLEANGLHCGQLVRPQYGSTILSACNKELHACLSEYVTGTFDQKTLTSRVLEWNEDALLRLLGSYVDGDGHVPDHGRNLGQLRIRSSSKQMLAVLSDIIRSLGVWTCVNYDTPPGPMVSPINGKTYQGNGSGVVSVAATESPRITKYSRKTQYRNGRVSEVVLHENTFLVRVEENEALLLHENVYNLEVEEEHHYLAGEVVVHNCNKDPLKAMGDVFKAFHNPQMHRVELLLGIRNSDAPDLIQRIADGEYLPCSMGCRIKYDVCTECGHRAPKRSDYCDHLKFNMRQVGKRGLRHGALNPSPKWFDISVVARPADQTGYMMKKVAEHAYEIRTSAEAGEYLDYVDQKKAALQKISDIDKVVRGIPVDHKVSPLTEEEGRGIKKYQTMIAPTVSRMPVMDPTTLNHLSQYPIAQTLSTLSAAGVILTTPEFIKILLAKMMPGAQVPESTLDAIVGIQGKVFDLFAQHPQLLEQLSQTGMFDISAKNVRPEIGGIAEKYLEKRSTIGEYLNRSMVHPLLRKEEPPGTDVFTVRDPVTGAQYQTNRGAALAASDEIDKKQLAKVLGGSALLGGAYKVIASGLNGPYALARAPLAATAGMLGYQHLRPDYGPQYMTDEGVAIPASTELHEVKAADELSSVALPMLGSAGLVAALSHDYESRLRRGENVNDPNAPLQTRMTDQLGSYAYDHPATTFMGGLGTAAAAKALLDKFSAFMGDLSVPGSSPDSVTLPSIDVDRAAEKIGSIVLP